MSNNPFSDDFNPNEAEYTPEDLASGGKFKPGVWAKLGPIVSCVARYDAIPLPFNKKPASVVLDIEFKPDGWTMTWFPSITVSGNWKLNPAGNIVAIGSVARVIRALETLFPGEKDFWNKTGKIKKQILTDSLKKTIGCLDIYQGVKPNGYDRYRLFDQFILNPSGSDEVLEKIWPLVEQDDYIHDNYINNIGSKNNEKSDNSAAAVVDQNDDLPVFNDDEEDEDW